MRLYQADPISDSRWIEFIEAHSRASVFHSPAWLRALRVTYDYHPVVFTTSPPNQELRNGLVFCEVNSWLTGKRLVSLPFSDHCDPLCDSVQDLNFLLRHLQLSLKDEGWKYLEIRPSSTNISRVEEGVEFSPAARHFLHILELSRDVNEIFRSLDKDSIQRRTIRADRAGLLEKCGSSDDILKDFYALFVTTRKRYSLPPIPYRWFKNLIQCLKEALKIRLAYRDGEPIAGILTLQFKETVYYKYGCSKGQFHRLGAMPWLLWKAIADAKSSGAAKFDLGRTDEGNRGLLRFKNHFVAHAQNLIYWKFPHTRSPITESGWKIRVAKRMFSCMPERLLSLTGDLIYRHIG